jgi:hypothetical protein
MTTTTRTTILWSIRTTRRYTVRCMITRTGSQTYFVLDNDVRDELDHPTVIRQSDEVGSVLGGLW